MSVVIHLTQREELEHDIMSVIGVVTTVLEGHVVIPTLIVFGLVFGRWWRLSLVTAAMGWPVLLVATDVMDFEVGLIGAAGLAVINAGVGVLVHQSVLRALKRLHERPGSQNRLTR